MSHKFTTHAQSNKKEACTMNLVPPQIIKLLPISAHPTLLLGGGASPNGRISVHSQVTGEGARGRREGRLTRVHRSKLFFLTTCH